MIGGAVGELLAGMEKAVKELDPEALSGPESLELFSAFHRMERLAAAAKALCARQMAATQAWFSGGHRSPCHLMAEATGSSVRIRPLAGGGRTELANLCRLCRFHHYLKTHHGWRITRRGKRWLWEGTHGPPPDPDAPQPELTAARG